jgi:beta-galactosidase
MKRLIVNVIMIGLCFSYGLAQGKMTPRTGQKLEESWKFFRGDTSAYAVDFDDSRWETVNVPHDWAIYGPFYYGHDLQKVAIVQNFEQAESLKSGRTGGLPFIGVGWYRTHFNVREYSRDKKVTLLFDGAMSEARVFINGKEAIFWPYGYNSFYVDVTDLLNGNGQNNVLAVRLQNREQSSRWYPGAGIYRNVHVVVTGKIHVPVWGTYITTSDITGDKAGITLRVTVQGAEDHIEVDTKILDKEGHMVAFSKNGTKEGDVYTQHFSVSQPELWSPEKPYLYSAETKIISRGQTVDVYNTTFGIRTIEIVPDKGFFLNGEKRKIKGVCNHHDLGPLGAAVNKAAIRHQLSLLKDMGCDAIRTSHNMPAPELIELCDEMGFMVMVEPFDEWNIPKTRNGYNRFFDEWAEKDMVNMIRQYRNNPSVIMWSIGNEVPNQCNPEGYKTAAFLAGICRREDPTRPVTCGMDNVMCVISNGFAEEIDVPGFNYRTHLYLKGYESTSHKIILGSETASTVSSRGVYKFPVVSQVARGAEDHQCSSYDMDYCSWSNVPEEDFALSEDYEWVIGQFVWTGFDYLGEPTPYDGSWPNHSSMFGIIDLASIPKDRYFLYRSVWNSKDHTLHMLPHWTWPGREGEVTPVFVYTDYPSAELFVNGVSKGVKSKISVSFEDAVGKSVGWGNTDPDAGSVIAGYKMNGEGHTLYERYRLMWPDVVYEPGEIKVIAYDKDMNPVAEKIIRTAEEPHHIELSSDRTSVSADGSDLAYINIRIVDKSGNLCPHSDDLVSFTVEGAGAYRASANGDPTCLDLFHLPKMHAFGGQLTAIVQSGKESGTIIFRAESGGIKAAELSINVK